ncbi:hypothetical protein EIN_104290 [Entamoeba invadens IP1]|uniref:Calcineurin-like phosphoesterase domain-containing protein n=1 Tax=Entamoeba invadens IP1 TaxID=370355 RepID=L7FNR2_ENTIV|nr:hypothetical protein EIN_104290 [Entamoeba invadens IP1]ELP88736.1 hypothetical protein EIN_104290 [Entamoeba invadens IP1]|eukprot:XP_004255507.1 hypothetical protein EIN_104290 [Entamoeba invadens IP1]
MAAVSIYGLIEGHLLHVKNITIKSDKFDRPFKFVHTSDIHIGSRFLSHAEKIVKLILKEKPQFVVITGDLTDSPNVQEYELLPFKKLSEKCPIYMCMGNHDYVTSKTKVEEITGVQNTFTDQRSVYGRQI